MKLTRRCIVYAVITILSFLPAVFVDGIYGWLPGFLLLFTALISFLYLLILRKGLECHVDVDRSQCRRGEESLFSVDLQSRSRLVLSRGNAMLYTEDQTGRDRNNMDIVFSMGTERQQKFSFYVRFAHIGVYFAGVRRFDLYDPLGLFSLSVPLENNRFPVTVQPKTVDISSIQITEKNRAETMRNPTRAIEGEGMDYSSVRNYVAGDPIKQIHWKLSAHMENYMTKVMEHQTNTGISIVLDTTSDTYTREEELCVYDCIIESGLSMALYAGRRGLDCDMTYSDRAGDIRKIIPTPDNATGTLLTDLPPLAVGGDSGHGLELVERCGMFSYGQANLILCTGCLTENLVQKVIHVRKNGKTPLVLLSVPPMEGGKESTNRLFPAERKALKLAQVTCLVLTDITDLR